MRIWRLGTHINFRHLILGWLLLASAVAQTTGIRVQQISPDQGLSQSTINAIYQDSRGYMWFGSTDGLNRFDGNNFKVYRYNPDYQLTLSDNYIRSMTEDHKKRLWIGTDVGGLNYLDLDHETFHQIPLYLDSTQTAEASQVWDLLIDHDNTLWVATWNGLFSVDLNSDTLMAQRIPFAAKQLRCLAQDHSGNLWIGTDNAGIIRYPERLPSEFNRVLKTSGKNGRVLSMVIDQANTAWIGLTGSLIEYHLQQKTIHEYPYFDEYGERNEVLSLWADDTDNTLWIGTSTNGLIQFDRKTKAQHLHKHLPNLPWGISESGIFDIYMGSRLAQRIFSDDFK